ncbi:MAG: condensation domain-containing protein [Gemmatimonadota bacterium]
MQAHALTATQRSMLYHRLGGAEDGVDIEQIVCTLPEAVDVARLEAAWARVIARHESLRGALRWDGPAGPELVVADRLTVPLEVIDLSDLAPDQREAELALALADDRLVGFELDQHPLLRLALYRFGAAEHRLVWSFPHVIVDGRSFGQVLGEVFAIYDADGPGDEPLPPEVPQFREFISWLEARDGASADEAFWKRALAGVELPTPLAPPHPSTREDRWGDRDVRLSAADSDAVRAAAARLGVPLSTIVAGAFALALAGPRTREVVFGMARGRRRGTIPDAERVVGCFLTVLPGRARLPRCLSVGPWLKALRAEYREATPHEHAALADIKRWCGIPAGRPAYEALLIFDAHSIGAEMRLRGGKWGDRWCVLVERTGVPITLYAYAEAQLHLRLSYDRRRLDDGGATVFTSRMATLLATLANDAATPLGNLVPSEGASAPHAAAPDAAAATASRPLGA